MASKPRNDDFKGVRVTVHSTNLFDTVITRLYSEIGRPEEALAGLRELMTVRDRESFIERVKKATGTTSDQDVMDAFMIFQVRPYPLISLSKHRALILHAVGIQPWRMASPVRCRRWPQMQKNPPRKPPHSPHDAETRY